MRKEDIHADFSTLAFDFFYWFSRFEFALKESRYLNSHIPGERAEPGWHEFVTKWQAQYKASDEAGELLKLLPQRQVVRSGDVLDWQPLDLARCQSDLDSVVLCLKTVRNNLFHGGKYRCDGWDDPKRSEVLLRNGKAVLGQLATLAGIEPIYTRYY